MPSLGNRQELSNDLQERLLRRISQVHNLPITTLTITNFEAEEWPDSCLGLGTPDTICAAVITPGWSVEVAAGDRFWIYRTDVSGSIMLQEAELDISESPVLPNQALMARLFDHISQNYEVPLSALTLLDWESRTWDGCYGIPSLESQSCPEIAILGTRTIVAGAGQIWIYHTNQDGTELHFNPIASQLNSTGITPRILDAGSIPPLINPINETVFSSIIDDDGKINDLYQVSLYSDRSLAAYQGLTSSWAAVDLGQLSYRDFFAFLEQLRHSQLEAFDGLWYSSNEGIADEPRITLVSGQTIFVQYSSEVAEQLPLELKALIDTWATLTDDR
ncbi:MAG: hypothetical protein F6K42_09040 [Leptolyngbya sp. SIO1D8]|nr:hypothetical protein [Leptolyngbya sp. SIO1D8]